MKESFSLIELIAVIVIIGILAIVAIPRLTRATMVAYESAAEANLRAVSAALESYATSNNGSYPTSEAQLTGATPPYLSQAFCGSTVSGYDYTCTLAAGGYSVVASPDTCGTSGSETYTVTTGGLLVSAACGG
ncbi:MAG: type II secretion system protein [Candidatus Omnitrophota bacterium]